MGTVAVNPFTGEPTFSHELDFMEGLACN